MLTSYNKFCSPKILCETKSSDVGSSSGILIKHRHGSVEAPGSGNLVYKKLAHYKTLRICCIYVSNSTLCKSVALLSAPSRDRFPIVELPKVNVSVISLPGMVVNCFDFNPKQDDMLVGK